MANRTAGLFFGQAFRWQAWHTQQLELALALDGMLPVATDALGGHPALQAVGSRRARRLLVPWSELVAHILVTGTTRSGKTRFLELLAHEVIQAPGAVVLFDPKGDRDLLARAALAAQQAGKPFTLITPAFPACSHRLNVLHTATTPAEVSARILALMPTAGGRTNEPFFTEYALALIERLAAAQQALGQPWTLEGLRQAAVFDQTRQSLLCDYLVHLGATRESSVRKTMDSYRKLHHGDLIAEALMEDQAHERDHFQRITGNLIPAFRGVVDAPLGPLFSALPPDVTWESIVGEQRVVYIALASMLIGDIANRIGRVILQDLIGYLGRRYAYEDMAQVTPMTVMIDELRTMVYPLFLNAVAMGGGAQARFILAQQSVADVQGVIGRDLADSLYDNLNTKVYFRLGHDPTAQQIAEGIGTCTVQVPETGVGLSYGGVGGLSGSSQRRLPQKTVPLLRPEWLKALPRGQAFVRLKGELWKLRVPLLEPVTATQRATLGLTTIWNSLAQGEHGEEERCRPSVC